MPKAKAVVGGWYWRGVRYEVGDVVDAPAKQLDAWEGHGLVERIRRKRRKKKSTKRKKKVEHATADPPEENASVEHEEE